MYMFKGPIVERQEHRLIVTVERNLRQDSISLFAREKSAAIMESKRGAKVMKNKEVTIAGGNPAFEFVVRWTLGDKSTAITRYTFVFWRGRGFTFMCNFTPKSDRTLSFQLKDIIEHLVPGTYKEAKQ